MIRPLFTSTALCAMVTAAPAQEALPPLTADNLVFSVENMDRSADPRQDFYRYAAGGWMDRVERPTRFPTYGIFTIMNDRLSKQVAIAAAKAGKSAADLPKGSPAQQVGDFYNAFMDVDAIDAAGIEPIRAMLDEIDAMSSLADITPFMAAQAATSGPGLFVLFGPGQDPEDSGKHALYAVGQSFGIDRHFLELLRTEPGDSALIPYHDYVRKLMEIAGYAPEDALRIADKSIAIETALYNGFLTPEEFKDPKMRSSKLPFDEVAAQVPEIDIPLYLEMIGFEKPDEFVMFQPRALTRLSEVLRETPLGDLKDYMTYRIVQNYSPFLDTELLEPKLNLFEALIGARPDQPRSEQVYDLLKEKMGHPASKVFVDHFYPEGTKEDVLDMVDRIRAVFRHRIENSPWLSDTTKTEALNKVDNFYYKVGFPDKWIDYSGVEIGHDPVANVIALGRFDMERTIDSLTRPPEHEEFNGASTLPIAMNAAYTPQINGFEVTAAITMAPALSPDMDAPLKFCRIGAVIGHEMTHGFDFGGRKYDATGNLRDWWTPDDTQAFIVEAKKLIEQADNFEVLPGLNINGALGVGENMADVGGITLAYESLKVYLEEHPEENVEIDGMSPTERCFVGWAQFWASKQTDQFLHTIVTNDGHAPDFYRSVAALQHLDAFYETYGIVEGDPMWLPPEKRARAW
ncbi:M13 family metallopeptidase [Acuticoccus kandeliae]|uniref:M13 family metallopeptidase n=1 Tax=Acuticoccus kandeliae TaxID=2073160 RepID=UPI000D3E5E22|nr:M13 family metallopeptidase [Acuticoccus kandeliae]